jgi:hypothetical protein
MDYIKHVENGTDVHLALKSFLMEIKIRCQMPTEIPFSVIFRTFKALLIFTVGGHRASPP